MATRRSSRLQKQVAQEPVEIQQPAPIEVVPSKKRKAPAAEPDATDKSKKKAPKLTTGKAKGKGKDKSKEPPARTQLPSSNDDLSSLPPEILHMILNSVSKQTQGIVSQLCSCTPDRLPINHGQTGANMQKLLFGHDATASQAHCCCGHVSRAHPKGHPCPRTISYNRTEEAVEEGRQIQRSTGTVSKPPRRKLEASLCRLCAPDSCWGLRSGTKASVYCPQILGRGIQEFEQSGDCGDAGAYKVSNSWHPSHLHTSCCSMLTLFIGQWDRALHH